MENGYITTRKLLESGEKFTAVYAMSDVMAAGVYRAVLEAGLRIPEDVSVVLAAASGRLLIDFTEQGAAKACHNLAGRLEGRRVPLMKLKK